MLKATLLAAVAAITLSTAAHATTVDMSLGTSYSYGYGSPVKANMNMDKIDFTSFKNAVVIQANGTQTHVPKGYLYHDEYVDVSAGGHATLKLSSGFNTFGFKWGTIDDFNSLVITDTRGVSYKITGTEMLNYLSQTSNKDQTNVVVTDPYANIVSVKFLSGQDSFEAANFFEGVSSVPLPATSMLFAMALAGLAFLGWRKQQG